MGKLGLGSWEENMERYFTEWKHFSQALALKCKYVFVSNSHPWPQCLDMSQFRSVIGQVVKFICLLCSLTNKECSTRLSALSNLRKHVQVSRIVLLINDSCIHSNGVSMVVLYFETKYARCL